MDQRDQKLEDTRHAGGALAIACGMLVVYAGLRWGLGAFLVITFVALMAAVSACLVLIAYFLESRD